MKIKLYQVNPEKDTKQVMFMPYGMIDSVNKEIYDLVYESNLPCSSLEEVYAKLNIDHPSDYRCRSMSVSDVVEVCESDTVPQGFYFCDMLGFKQIDFNSDDSSADTDPTSEHQAKISVLLVEPGKYPQMIEIANSLEAMQELVGGYIEVFACLFYPAISVEKTLKLHFNFLHLSLHLQIGMLALIFVIMELTVIL